MRIEPERMDAEFMSIMDRVRQIQAAAKADRFRNAIRSKPKPRPLKKSNIKRRV